MPIYDAYAPLYDNSGQIRFSLLMFHYLHDILATHEVAGRRMLDVACGTGTLALLLADEGWTCVGLDASEAMLAEASDKAESAEVQQVDFVQGDMRRIPDAGGAVQFNSFDLATCVYDSLNYLMTSDDLLACFQGVAWALAPGGLFVGDLNTRHFLEFDWGELEIQEHPGYVQIGQSHFDADKDCSTLVLTGFIGDDMHGYERFDETHVERAYPPEQISALLEQAGLRIDGVYDSFTLQAPTPRSQRIVWVARKPADTR